MKQTANARLARFFGVREDCGWLNLSLAIYVIASLTLTTISLIAVL